MVTPRFRALLIATLGAPLLGGCQSPKPAIVKAATLLQPTTGYLAETDVAVVPPDSQKCANGRAIISSWGNLFTVDLSSGAVVEVTAKLPMPTADASLYDVGGDEQLVRLKDDSILFLRQGSTIAPIAGPQPAWVTAANQGRRGINFLWRSKNCGLTWEVFHPLDSQDCLNGECAWPQGPLGQFVFGGSDRSELYADPWNGRVYLATSNRSGNPAVFPGHGLQENLLFSILPDQEQQWSGPIRLPWGPPLVLTSTKSGKVWLYHWLWHNGTPETFDPTLYISETQGQSVINPSGQIVAYTDTKPDNPLNKATPITSSLLAANQSVGSGGYALSRSGDADQVRLAHPSIENGRQVLNVAILTWSKGQLTVRGVHTFRAEEPDASIFQAAFVDSDRVDLPAAKRPATLFWLESSPSSGKAQVRYSVASDNLSWSNPAPISAAPWSPKLRADDWGGDYINGAFYLKNDERRFLLTWAQSEPGLSVENMNLHYAVVGIKP